MAVVKSCHEKTNVPFDQDNIDRVHRIGMKYTDETTRKKIQSITVHSNRGNPVKNFMMPGQEILLMVRRNQV